MTDAATPTIQELERRRLERLEAATERDAKRERLDAFTAELLARSADTDRLRNITAIAARIAGAAVRNNTAAGTTPDEIANDAADIYAAIERRVARDRTPAEPATVGL